MLTLLDMIWRGIAIGVIISAPMGPVGILCIQKTLNKGRRPGFYTGIGAAFSDLFYCLLTGFGLSFIEDFIERNQSIIQLFGSVVLIAFAIYLFRKNPASRLKTPESSDGSIKKDLAGGFLFTFSNPLILFLIIGLFARFNFMRPDAKFYHYIFGYLSIFGGALGWWWLVSYFVNKVRTHFNVRSMWLINRIIGILILIFAIVGILTASFDLANAAPRPPSEFICNSRRGFPQFSHPADSVLILSRHHQASDTSSPRHPESAGVTCNPGLLPFSATFHLSDLNSAENTRYPAVDEYGNSHSVKHPGWELRFTDGHSAGILIKFRRSEIEDFTYASHPALSAQAFLLPSMTPLASGSFDNADPFALPNRFRLHRDGLEFSLSAGRTSSGHPLRFSIPEAISLSDLSFAPAPGGMISISDFHWTCSGNLPETSIWEDASLLDEYLLNASDDLEGYYSILDRNMEEDLLKMGGNYRLAIVKAQDGYDILYLQGASVLADRWKPGMVKGNLSPSPAENIYHLRWIDAEGNPMSHEMKALRDGDILSLSFPFQNSSIRLLKSR